MGIQKVRRMHIVRASDDIMRECPRFSGCSAPLCPLDALQDYRDTWPNEPVCKLPKSTRVRLAEGSDLERGGMTKREWAASNTWNSQNAVEKTRRIANLKQNSSICTGSGDRLAPSNATGGSIGKTP